ncbi:T9SS type A sorting domain-containing protein [Hymenobacter volaticus]|uniref:T9SS type A sorting domain-containing protein n=1 Tax=Hymenobacter volaticus TaxID=2932254 RepID=A0ABY4G4Q8_9BACT|nr:T9SS type A sorting domain-containing protein [Hymenobacter volaticus]UOQ65880.1 T9SS type A sorting domain-containing protein [Hymenobacter volaticus]
MVRGTVNAKHLIAFRGLDDDFDTDNGYSGKVQYGVSLRDPQVADVASGGASNGFESDNDATGTTNTPRTSATFSNMSVFLPGPLTAADPAFQRGVHIRRNSAISLFNSVITGFRRGVLVDGAATEGNITSGASAFKNNVFADINSGSATSYFAVNTGSTFDANAYFNDAARANTTFTTVGALGYSSTNFIINTNVPPAFNLPAASVLNTGASFTDAKLADAFFDKTGTFRGAFGATNWAQGWTNFNPQITCYNAPGLTLSNRKADEQVQSLSVAPNPTEGAARLTFDLKRASTVTVRVLDITGRTVAVVRNGQKLSTGVQNVELPTSLQAGLYVASVTTAESTQAVRFVVAK